MSTNGVYCFRINGKDKVAYNHQDSYPSGLGKNIIDFIKNHTTKSMIVTANGIELVNYGEKPTLDQITRYRCFSNLRVGQNTLDSWYCLLHSIQGELRFYVGGIVNHMLNSIGRLKDWAVGWGFNCSRFI